MREHQGSIRGKNNVEIVYRRWEPVRPAKAYILLLHGLAEHSGRYKVLAEYLTERDFLIYAPDHRGHGLSGGERGLVWNADEFLDDIQHLHNHTRKEHPALPAFLLGHSFGGLLALGYLLRRQGDFAGAVLSGPALIPGGGVTPLTKALSRVLGAIFPRLGLQRLEAAWISRDPQVQKAYDEDPLNYRGAVKARTASEMLTLADKVFSRMDQITLPILCVHGGADQIINPAGSQQLHAAVSSGDKTLNICEGQYHETLNEPEKGETFRLMAAWLENHLPTNVISLSEV